MFLMVNPSEINVDALNCSGNLPSTIGIEHLITIPRNKHIHVETQLESLVNDLLDAHVPFR